MTGFFGASSDSLYGAGGAAPGVAYPIILGPGTLDVDTGGNSTGSVKWTLTYVPLDNGATVEAA